MTYEEIKRTPIEVLRNTSRGIPVKGILAVSDNDRTYFLSNDIVFCGDRSEWLMSRHPEFKYSWVYETVNLKNELNLKSYELTLVSVPGELRFKTLNRFSL